MLILRIAFYLLVALFIAACFRGWILNDQIIGGDWPFYHPDVISQLSIVPPSWNGIYGGGLGGKHIVYNLESYFYFTAFLGTKVLHLDWVNTYKIFWFGLFLLLSICSSYKLGNYVTGNKILASISVIIFTANTYILMVTGGGQMGIALSYAVAPIVIYTALKLIEKQNILRMFYCGLALGMQLIFDVRMFYITSVIVALYFVFYLFQNQISKFYKHSKLFVLGIFSYVVACCLNLFWIIPFLASPYNPLKTLGTAYTSSESVRFFSFADYSKAFTLLQPNWPTNIFGASSFLRPEFLLIPILGFAGFIYFKGTTRNNNQAIIFFGLLAIVSSLLAKGAQEPFGEFYVWLFNNFPGFQMFRDPTKWYLGIAIAYSILIPWSIGVIINRLTYKALKIGIVLLFFVVWGILIRESLMGELGGTFTRRNVPTEYLELKSTLQNDQKFSRVLWVPKQSRFSYVSQIHPIIEAEVLFDTTNSAQMKSKLLQNEKLLQKLGVGYVVVPTDPYGEIFVTDRKYDDKKRSEYVDVLSSISYLNNLTSGKLAVYKTQNNDSIVALEGGTVQSVAFINPYQLEITYSASRNATLYFAQNYDPSWKAIIDNGKIDSQSTTDNLTQFVLPQSENGTVTLLNTRQSVYNFAWLIQSVVGIAIVVVFFILKRKKGDY